MKLWRDGEYDAKILVNNGPDLGWISHLYFTAGQHTLLTGADLEGTGRYHVDNTGVLFVPANNTVTTTADFRLKTGGTIKGSGVAATDGKFVNDGSKFRWEGGTMESIRFETIEFLQIEGNVVLKYAEFITSNKPNVRGTVKWVGGDIKMISSATVRAEFQNFGTWEVTSANKMTDDSGAGAMTSRFWNRSEQDMGTGLFTKTASDDTTTIEVRFKNDGVIKKNGFPMDFIDLEGNDPEP